MTAALRLPFVNPDPERKCAPPLNTEAQLSITVDILAMHVVEEIVAVI